jgi:hypothetical protein
MTVDEIIKQINIKSSGRTRWDGQEPFWDEVLVAEIGRLRGLLSWYAAALNKYSQADDVDRKLMRDTYSKWELFNEES